MDTTCFGPGTHTQQTGLLQCPVHWLACYSASTFAVCYQSSCSPCTRATWLCFSYCTDAQLITLAQLSTVSDIQTILAHVSVSPAYLTRLCVPTSTVLGRSRLRLADDNQLVVPRTLTSTFGPRAFSTSGPAAWNTLSSELRDPSISLDCFRHLLKTYLYKC